MTVRIETWGAAFERLSLGDVPCVGAATARPTISFGSAARHLTFSFPGSPSVDLHASTVHIERGRAALCGIDAFERRCISVHRLFPSSSAPSLPAASLPPSAQRRTRSRPPKHEDGIYRRPTSDPKPSSMRSSLGSLTGRLDNRQMRFLGRARSPRQLRRSSALLSSSMLMVGVGDMRESNEPALSTLTVYIARWRAACSPSSFGEKIVESSSRYPPALLLSSSPLLSTASPSPGIVVDISLLEARQNVDGIYRRPASEPLTFASRLLPQLAASLLSSRCWGGAGVATGSWCGMREGCVCVASSRV
ncbi:hypothetical protein SCHPADRAFT_650190 [Schizopora paradoxa]|uniref:Uncharacterized protein n=1 Tax=Schizopora paradoxa TaxID=27342 RepID=A0A0H2R6I7_9AGAM|nr:hypothetical protein SCHPADRAFT_650190 [Schizopora paradoxa]